MQRPRRHRTRADNVGVHVEGLDDVLVRLAACCTPVPGDDVIGFITRGRGVSVHRADCANAVSLGQEQSIRMIEVDWEGERRSAVYRVAVEVVALDRSRLLRDVANALSEHHVNIVACDTATGNDRVAKMRFEFELADPGHLASVLRTIKSIDSVYDAYRLVPGAASQQRLRFPPSVPRRVSSLSQCAAAWISARDTRRAGVSDAATTIRARSHRSDRGRSRLFTAMLAACVELRCSEAARPVSRICSSDARGSTLRACATRSRRCRRTTQ